jgi:hypothetical protein
MESQKTVVLDLDINMKVIEDSEKNMAVIQIVRKYNVGETQVHDILKTKSEIFWYCDYGGETDISLNCSHFYRPIVHPQMRMNG